RLPVNAPIRSLAHCSLSLFRSRNDLSFLYVDLLLFQGYVLFKKGQYFTPEIQTITFGGTQPRTMPPKTTPVVETSSFVRPLKLSQALPSELFSTSMLEKCHRFMVLRETSPANGSRTLTL